MPELIILLGEGNYSFALDFVRILNSYKLLNTTFEVLASDFIPFDSTNNVDNKFDRESSTKTRENIQKLIIDYGVKIWTDVDARNLHNHSRLVSDLKLAIDLKRVHFIFNFPHIKMAKMKIDMNRNLLKDTFMSIEDLSRTCSIEVMVYISLCYGQSGINLVEPILQHRSWSDSWQLTEMASHGNFVLVNICSFSSRSFKSLFCDNIAKEQMVYDSNYKYLRSANSENKENLFCSNEELNSLSEEFENYNPFGYRQQNKPFRISTTKKFEGGNIFVFEHRNFVLNCLIPRHIYTHPLSSNFLVQSFIDDIREIILTKISDCRNVKPCLIEQQLFANYCTQPLDHYILKITLMNASPESHFYIISNSIGCYLNNSYVDDLLTEDLKIQGISFGFWSKDENTQKLLCLNLLVENCLRIKWNIADTRILYSKYFNLIDNPTNRNQKIATTGLLYPQTYHRDISFWWYGSQQFEQKEFFRMVWDHFQPTNIRSILLKEKYIKSINPMMISYCFRLIIESVDLALDRQKVHNLITTFGIQITSKFPQVKMR